MVVQAKAHVEEMERGKSRIIVTELPYQVNKSSLIDRACRRQRRGTAFEERELARRQTKIMDDGAVAERERFVELARLQAKLLLGVRQRKG